MRYQIKKICSWALILIMSLSTFQSAIAIDFVPNKQGSDCSITQKSVADANALKSDGNCPTEHSESTCIDILCISPFNFSSLQPPHAKLLSARIEFLQKSLTGCDAILSHYPDLLKRPPKT